MCKSAFDLLESQLDQYSIPSLHWLEQVRLSWVAWGLVEGDRRVSGGVRASATRSKDFAAPHHDEIKLRSQS